MAEYIEREASLAILRKNPTGTWRGVPVYSDDIKAAIHEVENLPAEDVSLVVHGKWIHDPASCHRVHFWFCSACRGEAVRKSRYCPSCGAKMEEAR